MSLGVELGHERRADELGQMELGSWGCSHIIACQSERRLSVVRIIAMAISGQIAAASSAPSPACLPASGRRTHLSP